MKTVVLTICLAILIQTPSTVFADKISQDREYFDQYILNSKLMSYSDCRKDFKTYCKKRINTNPYSIVEYIYNGDCQNGPTILVLTKNDRLAYVIANDNEVETWGALNKMIGIGTLDSILGSSSSSSSSVAFSDDKKCGVSRQRTSTVLLCKYDSTFRSQEEYDYEVKLLPISNESIFSIMHYCRGDY